MKDLYLDEKREYLQGEFSEDMEQRLDVKMLLYNQIPQFLPLKIQYIDNYSLFCYRIQGYLPLSVFIEEKKIPYALIRAIYEGFLVAMDDCREYFLSETHLVIQEDFIFWDARKKQILFCYFPGEVRTWNEQIENISQRLLKSIDHSDKKCVRLTYSLYEIVARDGFQELEIRNCLREHEERNIETAHNMHVEKGLQKQIEVKQEKKDWNQEKSKESKGQMHIAEKEMTTGYCLRRVSSNINAPKQITITKEMTLGRDEKNQCVIADASISRYHAKFEMEGKQIFIVDNDSTNGVFLNDKQLVPGRAVLCHDKDKISFADIVYVFEREGDAGENSFLYRCLNKILS